MNAPAIFTQSKLARALAALEAAKAREAEATLARVSAENRVLDMLGDLPQEGTTRHEDGGYIAVVTTSIRRAVDADKLAGIATQIPEAIGKRLIRWKPELVMRELRYLQENEPELYGVVAAAIEAKPAKPSIRIEHTKEAA